MNGSCKYIFQNRLSRELAIFYLFLFYFINFILFLTLGKRLSTTARKSDFGPGEFCCISLFISFNIFHSSMIGHLYDHRLLINVAHRRISATLPTLPSSQISLFSQFRRLKILDNSQFIKITTRVQSKKFFARLPDFTKNQLIKIFQYFFEK
jgi:hypothetical protein